MITTKRLACECGNLRFKIGTVIVVGGKRLHVRICQSCGLIQNRKVIWETVDNENIMEVQDA